MGIEQGTPLGVATRGMLAGAGGAVAVTAMVAAGRGLMAGEPVPVDARAIERVSAGQALSEGPGMPPNMNRVTATFVQKVATGIFGTSLSARQQYLAGTAWHLAYGGFWGVVYALLASSVRLPALLLGAVHGLVVWAVGFAWLVPRMRLLLPPGRQERRTTALVVGVHVAYGLVVTLLYRLLGTVRRKGGGEIL